MPHVKRNIAFFILFFISLFVLAQEKIPYSTDYQLKDGIYLQFSQFLTNTPLPKEQLVPFRKDDLFFLRNTLKKDTITFLDKSGIIQKVPVKEIWGFSENNYCYIYYNNQFNRVLTIGTIGFFVSSVTVKRTYFNDYPASMYYDPFYYPMANQTVESKELIRYLIDFTTGQVYPFDYHYLEQLIASDEKLFEEYSNLRKRKKRKLLIIYMRRFNEQHPLMLPKK